LESMTGNEQQHQEKCEDKYEEEKGKKMMEYRSKRNKFKRKYEWKEE